MHNASSLIKVPQPYLIGSDKADFEVCTVKKSDIHQTAREAYYDRLVVELNEWKQIQTQSQSLRYNLTIINKFLDASRFKPDYFEELLNPIEQEWARCITSLRTIHAIVSEFRYTSEENVVKQFLTCTDQMAIKSILIRIRTAKGPDDVLSISRSVVDIEQDIDTMLRVADLQIIRLISKINEYGVRDV